MEELFGGVDVEGGGFFVMKWAVADEGGAGALEREIGADDVHNVCGV